MGASSGLSNTQPSTPTTSSCVSIPVAKGYSSPIDLGYQSVGVKYGQSSRLAFLSLISNCGSISAVTVLSIHIGVDFQLGAYGLLKAVFIVMKPSLMGSFPFSPFFNISLNMFSSSDLDGMDGGRIFPTVVPPLTPLPFFQEKAKYFDPSEGMLVPVVNSVS